MVFLLWPPDAKNWLIWKDPDPGKDCWWEEKRMTKDKMVAWHHWLSGHVLVISRSWWWTGRPGMLQSMGSQRVRQDWATELNCTPKPTEIKAKINKWDLIKFKILCKAKDTVNNTKRQQTELENLFTNDMSNPGIKSKICKQLVRFSIKKQTTQLIMGNSPE